MNQSNPTSTENIRNPISWRWRDLSLRTKLIAAFLAATIIPLVILTYLHDNTTRNALTTDANEKLLSAASFTVAQLDTFINTNLGNIQTQANLPDVIAYLSLPASQRADQNEQLVGLLSLLARQDPVFIDSVSIMDVNGNDLVDTLASDIGVNKSTRDYFIKTMETGLPYASEVEFSETANAASIYFSAPVRDASGKIIGIIRTRYNAAILQQFISANVGLAGANSYPILLNASHVRLAEGNAPDLIFKSIVPLDAATVSDLQSKRQLPPGSPQEFSTNLPGFEAGLKKAHTQNFLTAEMSVGGKELEQGAVAPMKTQSWEVVFAQPENVFLAPTNTQAFNSFMFAVVMSLAVAFFGLFMAQTLAGPIMRLTQVAEKVSGGDINAQAKVESNDETGKLAGAFNSMTAQLRTFITTLEQRVADRTKALATSTEVSRRLSTILDQKELVNEVVNQVRNAFGYYHTQIYFYDEAREKLVMAGGTGEAGEMMLAQFHKITKGRGLVGQAAETNEPILVSDTVNSPDWLPNALLPETKSEVAIPISIGDQVLGVLDVQHNIVDGLKREDIDSLQSIANQVAVAMQNIQSMEIVAKRAAELQTVANISTAAATIGNIEEMLQEVVHLTQRGFGLYHAHVFTYNENMERLEIVACGYKEGDEHEGTHGATTIRLEQEQSLVARAARTRQAVIVNNVRSDPGWLPNPILTETASEMAVPMIVGDQLLGVLDVQSERLNAFTGEDASIQSTLASQVATALQNARNFAQSQHQAQRETAVNLITQKIQGATTVEAALQIAARELGHALGMKPTMVTLEPEALADGQKGARNDQ